MIEVPIVAYELAATVIFLVLVSADILSSLLLYLQRCRFDRSVANYIHAMEEKLQLYVDVEI